MNAGKKAAKTASPPPVPPGMVKRETLWLVALVALVVGFVAGVVFSAWRMEQLPGAMPPKTMGEGKGPAAPDFSAEIRELQQKTAANPSDTSAWTELGNRFFDSDRPQEAIAAYEKSLALDPSSADVWTDLGVMYRRVGEHRKAIEVFDKAMALNPRHEVSRFNKGIVLLHDLQDQAGALKAWEDLLRVNPLAATPTGQSVDEMIRAIRQNAAAMPVKKGQAPGEETAK